MLDLVIQIGRASDVWALGCILFQMAFGRPPFSHIRDQMLKIEAIRNPKNRIEFPKDQDPQLIDTLQRCLTRDPKKRATIQELLAHPYVHPDGPAAAPTSIMPEAVSSLVDQFVQLVGDDGKELRQALTAIIDKQMRSGEKIDVMTVLEKYKR